MKFRWKEPAWIYFERLKLLGKGCALDKMFPFYLFFLESKEQLCAPTLPTMMQSASRPAAVRCCTSRRRWADFNFVSIIQMTAAAVYIIWSPVCYKSTIIQVGCLLVQMTADALIWEYWVAYVNCVSPPSPAPVLSVWFHVVSTIHSSSQSDENLCSFE